MDRGASEDGLLVTVLLQSFQLTHVAFLLNSCATCNQMERKQQEGSISRMDYLSWVIRHKENCFHNHEGNKQVILLLVCCCYYSCSRLFDGEAHSI